MLDPIVFVYVALLVEAIITAVVMAAEGDFNKKNIAAFVVGGLLFWLFGIDLVAYLGLVYAVAMPDVAAQIISALIGAILIFRFSGNFNDLFDWVNGLRQS